MYLNEGDSCMSVNIYLYLRMKHLLTNILVFTDIPHEFFDFYFLFNKITGN